MKHLVGIGVLVAIAFVLRFWLHTSLGLDITIHDTYRVVPLRAIVFWFLMGTGLRGSWFLLGYVAIPDFPVTHRAGITIGQ